MSRFILVVSFTISTVASTSLGFNAEQCKAPHEKYIDCPVIKCYPKTCDDLVNPPDCPRIIRLPCPGGCVCEYGYLRNSEGICIKKKQCPEQCKAPHEKYDDCPALYQLCYPKTCDDLVNPPDCPGIIRLPCTGGCVCENGYLRNSRGTCIKKEQCPTAQCKKPHQRFTNCLYGVCRPQYCDEVGKPVICPEIAGPCPGGCVCESGFVWDSNKDCIDIKTCPSCGGDPNAVGGCGGSCGKTCEDLYRNKSELVCPQYEYCGYNDCECKPGYLLLNAGYPKKCILEKECPKLLTITHDGEGLMMAPEDGYWNSMMESTKIVEFGSVCFVIFSTYHYRNT